MNVGRENLNSTSKALDNAGESRCLVVKDFEHLNLTRIQVLLVVREFNAHVVVCLVQNFETGLNVAKSHLGAIARFAKFGNVRLLNMSKLLIVLQLAGFLLLQTNLHSKLNLFFFSGVFLLG